MDLSGEASAVGCEIWMSDAEISNVIGRKVTCAADVAALGVPAPGEWRTRVHIEAVRLVPKAAASPVLGCMIGPFSLAAGRTCGVGEALETTALEPETILALLEATKDHKNYSFRRAATSGRAHHSRTSRRFIKR
jgi:uroporphyrinogen-III decarboxylase